MSRSMREKKFAGGCVFRSPAACPQAGPKRSPGRIFGGRAECREYALLMATVACSLGKLPPVPLGLPWGPLCRPPTVYVNQVTLHICKLCPGQFSLGGAVPGPVPRAGPKGIPPNVYKRQEGAKRLAWTAPGTRLGTRRLGLEHTPPKKIVETWRA